MGRRAKPQKGKAEAKQSLSGKSPRTEDSRIRDLEKRLAEALQREAEAQEQQTATAEILRVISSSPTDMQPVFDAIAESALRLCGGLFSSVYRFDGDLIHMVAQHNYPPVALERSRQLFPTRPNRHLFSARSILERSVVYLPDVAKDPEHAAHDLLRAVGFRSVLSVPMLQAGNPVGAITVWHAEVAAFSPKHISLLETFADQAVIAIENVRLFTELQQKNAALTQAHAQVREALDQQTATSEVLRVISSSPTDVQPTFEAIARSARKLCEAAHGMVFRFDGKLIHLAAYDNLQPEQLEVVRGVFPIAPGHQSITGRAILTGALVHVRDRSEDSDLDYSVLSENFPTTLAVPLLRGGVALGAITVTRGEVRLFSDREIELLKTFADQAVIALENVRLFRELEARNKDLSEALDKQTATSEILRAISSSPTNERAVFDAIVRSAVRLCNGVTAAVFRVDAGVVYEPANYGTSPERLAATRARYPRPLDMETPAGVAVLTRSVFHVPDTENPSTIEHVRQTGRLLGVRSLIAVPMLRESEAVGALVITRRVPGQFSDAEVELLKTFTDQAIIAIENARLFHELQARTAALTRSVDELTALGEVSRAVSSTLDLETVLQTIVSRAVQIADTAGCTIWEYDEPQEEFRLRASHYADAGDAAVLHAPGRVTTIRKGQGMTAQVMEQRQPVQIPEITAAGAYESPIRGLLIEAGHRALLGVPLMSEDKVIGVLAVTRKAPGEFEPEVVRLLSTFATQSALAIQNARLFLEIEDKSRQLEVASRHKSEFLANMSHELRTPLNAIIGFSEVLLERMFGEINEKQVEYLQDIMEAGRHLLSLINDILDLSKIEAGRMELEVTDFDLSQAIDNAVMLVRERAGRRGITLSRVVDAHLGRIRGDERKIRQVLLNLLSNAIKFTPEGGRIDVQAAVNEARAEVSVADTGVGIAPQDQAAVFEEFRQVGTASRKIEGTGLGLALSRKFIELHGGRIWVESQVGHGSTFTFTLPLRREA